MELTNSLKQLLTETANKLKGAARRRFMAMSVKELGLGGQSVAEGELGWDRGTIRKGIRELDTGIVCVDNYSARGRKRAEEHLPHLLSDIQALVDEQSQTDPSFKTIVGCQGCSQDWEFRPWGKKPSCHKSSRP